MLTLEDMIVVGASAAAALIKLRCPKCGHIQARARAGPLGAPVQSAGATAQTRATPGTTYGCNECEATFSADEAAFIDPAPRRR